MDLYKTCQRVDILSLMNVLVHYVKAMVYLFLIYFSYSLGFALEGE